VRRQVSQTVICSPPKASIGHRLRTLAERTCGGTKAAAGHHNSVMGEAPRRWCHADGEHRIGRLLSRSFVVMSSCPTRSFEAKLCCGPRGSFCVMYRRNRSLQSLASQLFWGGEGSAAMPSRGRAQRLCGYCGEVVCWESALQWSSHPILTFRVPCFRWLRVQTL
jgi:hypothetical protein